MGSETNPALASASPSGKRSRDPEDEVYLDNLRSHKRYLSEIMASSLNGLTVGDTLPENLMESPARSDSMFYPSGFRDEMLQYSPMSEDSDDARYYECPMNTSLSQYDSRPTSPVSPCRYQRPSSGAFSSCSSYTSASTSSIITSSQPRQRGSDSEGRFPSSPSDICHSADLRRAALLRSVQMRSQPSVPSSFELPSSVQESGHHHNVEAEDQPCAYMKSLVDVREFHIEEECSHNISDSENGEKSCPVLNLSMKHE